MVAGDVYTSCKEIRYNEGREQGGGGVYKRLLTNLTIHFVQVLARSHGDVYLGINFDLTN